MNPVVNPIVELEKRVNRLVAEAQAIMVTDQQSYDLAAEKLLGLKALEREIAEHHREMRERTYAAWKSVCAAEKKLADPVQEAVAIYRERIAVYEAAQRRIADEARRQAELEALRRAELEREHELELAEAQGADAHEIAAMAAAPLPTVMPETPPATFRQASGVSVAANWRGVVISMPALVKAVAAGEASISLLKPDEAAINMEARSSRGTRQIPGIRFFDARSVRTRR